MTRSGDMDELVRETRDLHERFHRMIEPHRAALWRYCRMLTGSPWDGEDLFQETLLKAFAVLPQLWQPIVPKTYLFRIATHAWIDLWRKRKIAFDEYEEERLAGREGPDAAEIREALETLVTHLPPRQMAVLLLMDVFEFTAPEVAGMIHATEGAVYAVLSRARNKIRQMKENVEAEASAFFRVERKMTAEQRAAALAIIQALSCGDPQAFLEVMSETVHNNASPGFQEFGKKDMRSGSLQGFAAGLHASLQTLWGKEVVVVLAKTEQGPALHNIAQFECEGNRVVLQKSWYFCKELLLEAGRELGLPVQLDKPAVNWA